MDKMCCHMFNGPKRLVKNSLRDFAISNAIDRKRELACMPQQTKWFVLQNHVTDSSAVGDLNRVREKMQDKATDDLEDADLGIRRPGPTGDHFKFCPLCKDPRAKLTEAHVILECSRLNFDRAQRNIRSLPTNSPTSNVTQRKLVGGDNADLEKIWNRAKAIEALLEQ